MSTARVRPKLLLAGYFGCGNVGDDAILLGFLRGLEQAPVDVGVASGAPEETSRLYGVRAFDRKSAPRLAAEIAACDAVVFPGGSIFQDQTSWRSALYYASIVARAKRARRSVFLLGQGVGPLTTFLGKRAAAKAFSAADLVAVRDPQSAQLLKSMGVKGRIEVTADMAFLLPSPPPAEEGSAFQVGGMRSIGVVPRPFGKGGDVAALFGDVCRGLYQSNLMPVLIEMDRVHDGPLIDAIEKSQGGKVPGIRKVATPMQLQQRLARMDAVISVRLHGGVLAATVGVAPFMVSYDPKVSAFAASMGLPPAPSLSGLGAPRLVELFLAFHQERERYARLVAEKRETMALAARRNVTLMLEQLSA
jgi:polysaccharide pyruvyl transferase CsaB